MVRGIHGFGGRGKNGWMDGWMDAWWNVGMNRGEERGKEGKDEATVGCSRTVPLLGLLAVVE